MSKRQIVRAGAFLAAAATVAVGCAPAPGTSGPGPAGQPTPGASASAGATPAPVQSAAASLPPGASPGATPTANTGAFALTGYVIDINRDPVPNATVTARRGEAQVGETKAGADGRYSLSLPSGDYEVTASFENYTSRHQPASLQADLTLNFGPTQADQTNPFFLADTPEIERVEVKEENEGGPLELRVHFSEAMPVASQKAFDDHVELLAGRSTEFLESRPAGSLHLKTASAWDEAGKVYVFSYPGPYLASGDAPVEYSLAVQQEEEDTVDPETQEQDVEDLGIVDSKGNPLGRGRAAYAFVKPMIPFPSLEQLTDKQFGYLTQDRRWRLSHDGLFTFTARKDQTPPALERVELRVDEETVVRRYDVLTLTFTEPMAVAKDRDELEWTRLDIDRPMVILNLAADDAGKDFKPLAAGNEPREIVIDPHNPRIVYVHYAANTFQDQQFVEVTLTSDAQDPAGNKPDSKRRRLTGPVVGG